MWISESQVWSTKHEIWSLKSLYRLSLCVSSSSMCGFIVVRLSNKSKYLWRKIIPVLCQSGNLKSKWFSLSIWSWCANLCWRCKKRYLLSQTAVMRFSMPHFLNVFVLHIVIRRHFLVMIALLLLIFLQNMIFSGKISRKEI